MSLILGGYTFNGLESISKYVKPEERGLYGIFSLRNPEKSVADYSVLFMEEIEKIDEIPDFPQGHPKYSCWVEKAGGEHNLYIGYLYTPGTIPRQIEALKRSLIHKYNPMCNK